MVPHLNVMASNLVFMTDVETQMHWRDLKRIISYECGKVEFVETFEAWLGRRIGSVILHFRSAEGRRQFVSNMPNSWYRDHFNGMLPTYQCCIREPRDRARFFRKVKATTGVDLVECQGVPPLHWSVARSRSHQRTRSSTIFGSSGHSRRSSYYYQQQSRHQRRFKSSFNSNGYVHVDHRSRCHVESGSSREIRHDIADPVAECFKSLEVSSRAEGKMEGSSSYKGKKYIASGSEAINSGSAEGKNSKKDDPMMGEMVWTVQEDEILLI